MSDVDALIAKLKLVSAKIEHWRTDAKVIRTLSDRAVETRTIDESTMLHVEETAGDIYQEIAAFDDLVAEIGGTSPTTAALLAEVGDALRLTLMEITELSTRMYSVKSLDIMPGEDTSATERGAR